MNALVCTWRVDTISLTIHNLSFLQTKVDTTHEHRKAQNKPLAHVQCAALLSELLQQHVESRGTCIVFTACNRSQYYAREALFNSMYLLSCVHVCECARVKCLFVFASTGICSQHCNALEFHEAFSTFKREYFAQCPLDARVKLFFLEFFLSAFFARFYYIIIIISLLFPLLSNLNCETNHAFIFIF